MSGTTGAEELKDLKELIKMAHSGSINVKRIEIYYEQVASTSVMYGYSSNLVIKPRIIIEYE